MDQSTIKPIWAKVLEITKEQYQLDYSGYTPKGIRGGLRILNPRGDEAIRHQYLEQQAQAKEGKSLEDVRVEVTVELLTQLPPWPAGEDAPQLYVLDNEPDWVALYNENAEELDVTHVPVDDPVSVGLPTYVYVKINGCPVRCIPRRNPDISDKEGDMGWIYVPLGSLALIFGLYLGGRIPPLVEFMALGAWMKAGMRQ